MDMAGHWISVSADGEATVAPDAAMVSLAVSATGKDLPTVRDDVNTRTSAVLATLRELEIAEADIQAPGIGIQPQYDYQRGQRLTGYRVSRQVSIRVRNLDRLGDVLDGVVGAGANEVNGAQMTVVDPSATEDAALAAAVEAARRKAQAIATAAGASLGKVARIEEEPSIDNSPRPMLRAAMTESMDAATEVAPGEITVTRRIRAWFDLG